MASLRDTVKQYQEELRDGIAWIAFWREGRSWNGEDFYLDAGDSLTAEQKSRLEEIRQKDPAAVILNSYYCGYLAGDMTVDELTAGVRRHYDNGYNDVADFIAEHDDTLSPEVLEKARALAHAAGLPFYERPYNGEEIDPYIYDGYMSIEDYELMHQKIAQERSEHLAEQFSILIDSRSRFETGQPGGVWLPMPTTAEQLHKAMNRIGITAENSQDFFINGFANTEQQPFDVPLSVIQSAGIDELNYFGKLLEMRGDADRGKFAAAVTLGEYAGSVKDLCAGPHLDSTGRIKGNALKLTACNAAYWRGDSNRETLQRIYGIAFPKKDELDAYLAKIEEAKKRDHRKLGKELGLFMLRDEGPGFPFFLPKGMTLKNTLLDYWRQVHKKYGYVEISTPIMLNRQLWERSGHWDHYKNNMYTTVIDDVDFAVKPMNCPGGMLVYASQPHSYKELPLRVGEIGLVHRHELSGALHGLFRVRCFNQDDAHVFMTRDQMQDVIQETVRLFDEVYSVFGLSYTIELSTMPEDHIGTVEEWERNQDILKNAITAMGKDFVINEGDGAFYGPKLDFHLADSLGRTWQCGTIQLDSQLPERFELEYTGEDGQKHRPVMIHRVVLGSIERFIGVITEHFAGAFPAWLAPVQVKVLPVTDRAAQYADQISKDLDGAGFRVEVDHRNEKIGKKIREATMEKVPYMLVVGDRDMEGQTVSVRMRSGEDLGAMSCVQFQALLAEDVRTKAIK